MELITGAGVCHPVSWQPAVVHKAAAMLQLYHVHVPATCILLFHARSLQQSRQH